MNEKEAKLGIVKLQQANQRMRRMLESIGNISSVVQAEQISQLQKMLEKIREEKLIQTDSDTPPGLFQEIRTYRENLEKLQRAIPAAQIGLEIKRTSLERSRSHQEAVSDWFRVQDSLRS